jgi:hypothetical protein
VKKYGSQPKYNEQSKVQFKEFVAGEELELEEPEEELELPSSSRTPI